MAAGLALDSSTRLWCDARSRLTGKAAMPPIVNEFETSGLTNDRGTRSMARTSDAKSATSQLFVNLIITSVSLE